MRLNQVTVGCTDYAQSTEFYSKLGLKLIVDAPPRYARFETPSGETFSLHRTEKPISPSTIIYFETEELDQIVANLKEAGLNFITMPKDESWGWREARLCDPAGNEICLFWGGRNRRFPPWRIDDKIKD